MDPSTPIFVGYQEKPGQELTWFTSPLEKLIPESCVIQLANDYEYRVSILKILQSKFIQERKGTIIRVCFGQEEYDATLQQIGEGLTYNYPLVPRHQRIPRESMFMKMAELLAERSTCTRAKVGALLTREHRVISTGYVGAPSGQPHCLDDGCEIGPHGGCIRTVHAEVNCIAWAAREGINTQDTTLYVTLSPCLDCAKLLINAGIKKVIYLRKYRTSTGIQLLQSSGVEVVSMENCIG